MKISDLSVQLVRWPQSSGPDSTLGVVQVETDAGLVGHSFLGTNWRGAHFDTPYLLEVIKPLVLGRNPLDSEAIWQEVRHARRDYSIRAIGAFDVALMDIAGKAANLPVFRLLGAYRSSLPAYASTGGLDSPEAFAREAVEFKDAGWSAYKIHPPRNPKMDVNVAVAVRSAVGANMKLMFDPVSAYGFPDAVRVGRELEELGYEWFEDPLDDANIEGYIKLREKLNIPIMATEYSPGGFTAYAPWLTSKATDYLRGDVAIKGGITSIMKTAHLAEAFHMNYEVHHGGNSLNNVANLHTIMAMKNCEFFEVLLPSGAQKYGLETDIEIDSEGNVSAFNKPGLGADIDFDLIERNKIAVVS